MLSSTSQVDSGAGTLVLVGEVWNEFTSTRGPITVTAKLYDGSGHLLTTRSAQAIMYAPSHTSVPFRISGSLPAGFDRVVYSLSAPTSKTVRSVSVKAGSFGEVDGRWKATGTIKATSGAVRSVRMALILYDGRGTGDRRRQGGARQDDPGIECLDVVLGVVDARGPDHQPGARPRVRVQALTAAGSSITNVVPSGPVRSTSMRPPFATRSSRAMVRPIPVPAGRPVTGSTARAGSPR